MYIAETKRTEHLPFLTYDLICTVLRETKYTMDTSSKNTHIGSLNQEMYMTYNNKDIDAYLYTTSEFIYHLFYAPNITLYLI